MVTNPSLGGTPWRLDAERRSDVPRRQQRFFVVAQTEVDLPRLADSGSAGGMYAMATVTKTITINAAFLQEIKEDSLGLRQQLTKTRQLLAGEPSCLRPRDLVETLAELRDQFALHFALEEAYGYFEDAVDGAPWLHRRAESLRAEHRELFMDLCRLEDEAERLLYHETPHRLLSGIVHTFHQFHERFCDHESRENDLILESVTEEFGEGD
jgi:iron-sulfur cluster repair protein YtfE (RIC family)